MKKTTLIQRVEKDQGALLERFLVPMVEDAGEGVVAKKLGVSKSIVGYWLLKLGYRRSRRYVLINGDEI
jgi:peptide deformylase